MQSMALRAQKAASASVSAPAASFQAHEVEAFNALRLIAARARCAARADPTALCSLLNQRSGVAAIGYAEALFRSLATALERRLVVYAAGDPSLSADEAWLLRVLVSARDGDEPSLNFLIRSRVAAPHRRQVAFLTRKLASKLESF